MSKHTLKELLTLPVETLKRERWERGRLNYRESEDEPFKGNPLAESLPEIVDFLNYTDVLLHREPVTVRAYWVVKSQEHARAALDVLRIAYADTVEGGEKC